MFCYLKVGVTDWEDLIRQPNTTPECGKSFPEKRRFWSARDRTEGVERGQAVFLKVSSALFCLSVITNLQRMKVLWAGRVERRLAEG